MAAVSIHEVEFSMVVARGTNIMEHKNDISSRDRLFKRSKYSSAYRFGFSVVSSSKWSFAQVHRIKAQNEVLSVILGY